MHDLQMPRKSPGFERLCRVPGALQARASSASEEAAVSQRQAATAAARVGEVEEELREVRSRAKPCVLPGLHVRWGTVFMCHCAAKQDAAMT